MWIRTKIEQALKRGREQQKEIDSRAKDPPPPQKEFSVTPSDAKDAQESLRTLEVEGEVLSLAIRRLYQAEADGRINKNERDRLANSYKERIAKVKKGISRSRSIVALHELEEIRSDLIKLFNNHFSDLNVKIGNLRSHLELKPISTPPSKKKKKKKRKKRKRSKAPKKNKAEEKIEKIRAEIDKTLDRLGQIEAEA
ncbi:hypothetical protein GWO13_10370 [Candidatus Bathyarchaeota archaeon]|nr:hypothetical protein [Candidatus Bathyarchaeota archaeon]